MLRGREKTVFVRLMTMHLISVLITLAIIGGLFGFLLQKYYSGVREWELIEAGNQMISLLVGDMAEGDMERVHQRLETLTRSSDVGLWIINRNGEIVVGVPERHGSAAALRLDPMELVRVLGGSQVTKKLVGPQYQNLLVVLPIRPEGEFSADGIIGALALRTSLGDVGETVNSVMRLVLLAGLAAASVVVLLSFLLSRGFSKPLESLKQATIDIAHGKFRQLQVPAHSSEVNHLVKAFNYASEKIENATLEQRRLERLRKDFLASISHELRVPLTSLKGFLELMECPLPDGQRQRYISIMSEDVEYLERLVHDVSEISKMDSNQFQFETETLALEDVLRRTIRSLEYGYSKHDIGLHVDIEKDLPPISGDPQRLHQVFLNLLVNAMQHSKGGDSVFVRARKDDDQLVVEVEDQGPGIPAEHQQDIWERFYKLDKARTRVPWAEDGRDSAFEVGYSGRGLGLAIVREITEAHGGKVGVASVEGEGSTFFITLPIRRPKEV